MLIAILEDDPTILEMLGTGLRLSGHEVRVFSLAESLILSVQGEMPAPYDVLICDLMLSGSLTGADVIREIRRFHPYLPAILMSGASPEHLAAAAGDLCYVVPMRKPFTFRELHSLLDRLTTPVKELQPTWSAPSILTLQPR